MRKDVHNHMHAYLIEPHKVLDASAYFLTKPSIVARNTYKKGHEVSVDFLLKRTQTVTLILTLRITSTHSTLRFHRTLRNRIYQEFLSTSVGYKPKTKALGLCQVSRPNSPSSPSIDAIFELIFVINPQTVEPYANLLPERQCDPHCHQKIRDHEGN